MNAWKTFQENEKMLWYRENLSLENLYIMWNRYLPHTKGHTGRNGNEKWEGDEEEEGQELPDVLYRVILINAQILNDGVSPGRY